MIESQRYGKLVAFNKIYACSLWGKDKQPKPWWECTCDCGNYLTVRQESLRSGNTKSCGCIHKQVFMQIITKHGEIARNNGAETKIYRTWKSIKSRCYNPNTIRYKYYGGKGVRVCDRWLDSFELFKKDMGLPPTEVHSIDRIDSNGDYCPENCRWATPKQQRINNSMVNLIEYNGKTQTLTEWSQELGINRSTLSGRINRYGWTTERAFSKK